MISLAFQLQSLEFPTLSLSELAQLFEKENQCQQLSLQWNKVMMHECDDILQGFVPYQKSIQYNISQGGSSI